MVRSLPSESRRVDAALSFGEGTLRKAGLCCVRQPDQVYPFLFRQGADVGAARAGAAAGTGARPSADGFGRRSKGLPEARGGRREYLAGDAPVWFTAEPLCGLDQDALAARGHGCRAQRGARGQLYRGKATGADSSLALGPAPGMNSPTVSEGFRRQREGPALLGLLFARLCLQNRRTNLCLRIGSWPEFLIRENLDRRATDQGRMGPQPITQLQSVAAQSVAFTDGAGEAHGHCLYLGSSA